MSLSHMLVYVKLMFSICVMPGEPHDNLKMVSVDIVRVYDELGMRFFFISQLSNCIFWASLAMAIFLYKWQPKLRSKSR